MPLTVSFGPLRFRTRADLDAIRIAFVAQTPGYGLTVIGASVNGQSFQLSYSGVTYTEEEFGDILATAYCDLGITDYGVPSATRTVARFTDGQSPSHCAGRPFGC